MTLVFCLLSTIYTVAMATTVINLSVMILSFPLSIASAKEIIAHVVLG